MRFHLGPIPDDESFEPDVAEWQSLTEPGPVQAQITAIPIMVVSFAVVYALLNQMAQFSILSEPPLMLLAVFVPVIALHELCHAFFHPGRGRTSNSVLGFWPTMLVFYAQYFGPLPRDRFIVMLLAPFVLLTLAPVSAACLIGQIPWWAGAGALLNAAASCVDLLGVLILLRIPPESLVRNKGWKSYWKTFHGL